ncbi:hypothetical protein METBIDRAFT_34970 [Metschnikowia bicuspidata var. bicuspidata NRRL YB-4993]|uniref:Uncharacterized protein n=1 Tax=Metschnikowia bicuspidata var. bicuspidata NRRL YB-4993 TaxID=869754 RepID=A0A1A0HGW5_9ASCO|nr:hypothetical protein METBIDRAFT_34970 [Metschnikowia bicuspidata var. bicuspidata NRRL YB-4993]OBA23419.1 hypothetical protein METBIDRAFT_34970 [Metschnikowia bicuspidata var. bicuspidata NRRL YB-4993]
MSRSPRIASDRLLNLLYKKTVPEAKPRIPAVKRVLYDDEFPSDPSQSVLDGLMKYQWRRKPMTDAIDKVCTTVPGISKSNVLRLGCKNAFVGKADLVNLFPIVAEREYLLDKPLENGLNFHFIKARNPISLLFLAAYYLVFPNFNQACVYYLETLGKQINGLDLDLQFLALTSNELKRMASPVLENPRPIENFMYRSENYGSTPITDIFSSSPIQLKTVEHLVECLKDRSLFVHQEIDPLFTILGTFLGQSFRQRLVIVRNMPLGVTGPAIESLLWDYEFENEDNPQASITNLYSDASAQITIALLKFKDQRNAKRFVRNYHGRKWNKVTTRKEKSFYEPILCEIAD